VFESYRFWNLKFTILNVHIVNTKVLVADLIYMFDIESFLFKVTLSLKYVFEF